LIQHISKTTEFEGFLILKNTRHDDDVEGYLRMLWMKCSKSLVEQPGKRVDFIFGSVEVIMRARQSP
jgi:hypothetical protein